jgi:hypothetical protein
MLTRHHPASLAALLLLPVLLGGCAVVGVKVQELSPRAERAEARRLVKQNNGDTASQLLLRAGQRNLAPAEKLASLLEAARLTSTAGPGSPAHLTNQAALREIVSLMQTNRFEPLALPDGRQLTVAGGSRKTLDPRTVDKLIPASAVHIKRLRVRTTIDGAGVP